MPLPLQPLAAPALLALALAACQGQAFPMQQLPGAHASSFTDRWGKAGTSPCADWREARLDHPIDALLGNPAPADGFGFGCANQVDLERMVVNPGELHGLGRTGKASSPSAVGAVERYYGNQVTDLPARSLSDSGNAGQ